ncbi:MAG: esterase family protein [Aquincola sp.]|nr:esterase family protein [Aquincola sp.]MDH5328683.1 esterase family protein [Aquincola sp.]
MIRRLLTLLLVAAAVAVNAQPLPQPASGRVERLTDVASRHVAPRHVDVWLPDNYDPSRRHAVIYMQDGQMLFDARTTWNGQAWNADVAVARLVKSGRIAPAIIVGVWNNGPERYAEYYPQKMLSYASESARREYVDKASNGRSKADAYLRFLVEELKPMIDRRYATRSEPEATFVVGSSMGGMISLYALCEYPQVFGAAAGLSTHWVGIPTGWGLDKVRQASLGDAAVAYMARHLPAAGRHRLYIDRGTDALDSLYAPALDRVATLLHDRGFSATDAATRVIESTGHNERDWAARLEPTLAFLMAPR